MNIDKIITEVEDMHPYKQAGNRDSYSEYAEGWSDACDVLGQRVKEYAEQFCQDNPSHNLLRDLRQVYLVNLDTDGRPKASLNEILSLWDRVNKELDIKQ